MSTNIGAVNHSLSLRDVISADLPLFFAHQQDPEAQYLAAFISKEPGNRASFDAHWHKIMADPTVIIRTILWDRQVAGHVLSYETDSKPEVSYWLDRACWGQGIATRALAAFLAEGNRKRPIFARVAKDNTGSLRVLEKCGFMIIGEDEGYAHGRQALTAEWILELIKTSQ